VVRGSGEHDARVLSRGDLVIDFDDMIADGFLTSAMRHAVPTAEVRTADIDDRRFISARAKFSDGYVCFATTVLADDASPWRAVGNLVECMKETAWKRAIS
jgi:hypothetical protein